MENDNDHHREVSLPPPPDNEPSPRMETIDFLSTFENGNAQAELANLPEPVNEEDEDLLRLTLGTRQLQTLSMFPTKPSPELVSTINFSFPYELPLYPMVPYFYPLTQNPTPEQPSMQPLQAEPENPPPPPARRDTPGPVPVPVRRADQRSRSERSSAPKNSEKSMTIEPRFPWATDKRAIMHDLNTLAEKGIESVSGEVCCSHCKKRFSASYNVVAEFSTLRAFVEAGKGSFNDRAPREWDKPVLPDCETCGQKNCLEPVIEAKKRDINWLFLLLGKFVGLCSLAQLKYLCKHTKNHRTGAKDRIVYLAYLGLLKQLDETGPFDALF